MNIDIVDEKQNKLFKRKDLTLSIKHDGSPTAAKADLVKSLAASNKVDESQVVVEYIFTKKGVCESVAKAKILDEKPPAEEQPKEEKKEDGKDETQADKGA